MAQRPELVVFIHSVGGSPAYWEPQLAALSPRYEVRAVELKRPAGEVSMEAFADDVAGAIAQAGYSRAHLVGLSMGAVVAQLCWDRHPEQVKSLTLCNSWVHLPPEEAAERIAFCEQGFAQHGGLPGFSKVSLPGLFAPTTDKALVERCAAIESAKDGAMYLACWRAMFQADLRSIAARCDVPVMLLGGALDPVTPMALFEPARERLPVSRWAVLENASHFSNLDCPEQFNQALTAFLREAGGGDDRLSPPPLEQLEVPAQPAAERLLELLQRRGVEAFFSNSGTDFTPIIDALAHREALGLPAPRVVLAPHENTVVALAHGHALVSRRAQVAMVHVNVGTANIGLGLINARRARVPMLALAGRTPWYEEGKAGVRTNFVQWGQDTFDQGAMFREFTKFDYEVKGLHALETIVDRALAVAESAPQGPAYLMLPKEPLCEEAPAGKLASEPRQRAARPVVPEASGVRAAAEWVAKAGRVLVVTADAGRHVGVPEALVRFVEASGAGVCEHGKRNFFNFPTEHPQHLGFEPTALLGEFDLVVAIECPVPWIPAWAGGKRPRCIQLGVDPLFGDIPMRGFPADLALQGELAATLKLLTREVLRAQGGPRPSGVSGWHDKTFGAARAAAAAQAGHGAITKPFLSWSIGEAIDDRVVLFNEYDLDPWLVPRRVPDSWFENSCASGLGWSLGAALGAQLAAPDKTMMVTAGDGSYLFNAPLSAHYVAVAEKLPIIVVIFNDGGWSTIKRSTKGSHPEGWAVRTGRFALSDFSVPMDYAKIAEGVGATTRRVEKPSELKGALHWALSQSRQGGRHVVLDVVCERDG